MDLLIDEDVPQAVTKFLSDRGHNVTRVIDALGQGTEDPLVASYANTERLIVVTFNLRDYNTLIARAPRQGHDRFPDAGGLIGLQCPHPQGRERVEHFIEAIEHEHGYLARKALPDGRLIIQITETIMKIVR
jgi:hypothetical protein